MSYAEVVLPFITEEGDGERRSSRDMEVAAVLCLAEANRRKKLGIFGGKAERLTRLAALHYPLWAVPWDDRCLLVEGIEPTPYALQHPKPADVEAFTEHLKRSSTVQELYRNALRSHADSFSDFVSTTEIPLKGLVADEELLSDVSSLMKEAHARTRRSTSLIPPRIPSHEAINLGKTISDHYKTLQSEMKGLQYAIDVLTEETKVHVEKMQQELALVEEKYAPKIAAAQVEVEKKTTALKKERDEKTETVAAGNKREVEKLLAEKKKWEQELTRLSQDRSEYDKRRELRERMKDEVGKARWSARLREVKNQISTIKGKIKTLSRLVARANEETETTLRDIHATYQKRMDLEKKRLGDLERLRNSETEEKKRAMEELQNDARVIEDNIERLIDLKREHALMLKRATMQWKAESLTLVHLPMYLVQYETEKGQRIAIHAPKVLGTPDSLLMKIRKTLKRHSLRSRMRALLKSRSKAIEIVLKDFEEQLNRDEDLRQILSQVSAANNRFASPDFKANLRTGIGELEAEEWVTPEEREAILSAYAG